MLRSKLYKVELLTLTTSIPFSNDTALVIRREFITDDLRPCRQNQIGTVAVQSADLPRTFGSNLSLSWCLFRSAFAKSNCHELYVNAICKNSAKKKQLKPDRNQKINRHRQKVVKRRQIGPEATAGSTPILAKNIGENTPRTVPAKQAPAKSHTHNQANERWADIDTRYTYKIQCIDDNSA